MPSQNSQSKLTGVLLQMLINRRFNEQSDARSAERAQRDFMMRHAAELGKEKRAEQRKIEAENRAEEREQRKAIFEAERERASEGQSQLLSLGGGKDAILSSMRESQRVDQGIDALTAASMSGNDDTIHAAQAGLFETTGISPADPRWPAVNSEVVRRRASAVADKAVERADEEQKLRDSAKAGVKSIRAMVDAINEEEDPRIRAALVGRLAKLTEANPVTVQRYNPTTGEFEILTGPPGWQDDQRSSKLVDSYLTKWEQVQTMTRTLSQAVQNRDALGVAGGFGQILATASGIADDFVRSGIDPRDASTSTRGALAALQDSGFISGDVSVLESLRFEELQVAYFMAQAFRSVEGNRVAAKEIDRMVKRFRIVGGVRSSDQVIAMINKARNLMMKQQNTLRNKLISRGVNVDEFTYRPWEEDALSRSITGGGGAPVGTGGGVPGGMGGGTTPGFNEFKSQYGGGD